MKKLFLLLTLFLIANISFAKELNVDVLQIGKVGSSVDAKFQVLDGAVKPYLKYDKTGSEWLFSNDGIAETAIGSGAAGGTGGIASLDNPGFEDGFETNWACTATKCTEETTAPLVLEKSLVFTPTVQNDEFVSDLKTLTEGLKGVACEARVYYTGGDENLTAQVVNGDAEVIASQVLQAHSIAGYESIFFLCPSAAAIIADADKGNLQLKVINEQVGISVAATFDEMYLGSLIGLTETQTPDQAKYRIDNNGAAVSIATSSGDLLEAIARTGTGIGNGTFKAGVLTVIPLVECQPIDGADGATQTECNITSITTSGFSWITNRDANDVRGYRDADFSLTITKQDADAKQSVQLYKNIPKVSQNVNSVIVKFNSDGTIASKTPETSGITFSSRSSTGIYYYNIGDDFLDDWDADCNVNTTVDSTCNTTITANTLVVKIFDGGTAVDRFGSITLSKIDANYVTPTVQPVLVNQVDTKNEAGSSKGVCHVINTGSASFDSSDGDCWFIDSVSWISSGKVTINSGYTGLKCTISPLAANNTAGFLTTSDGAIDSSSLPASFRMFNADNAGTTKDDTNAIACSLNR